MHFSVAMTEATESALLDHLARADGQEDLCFATWYPSSGPRRRSALISEPVLPREGDRHVHGNASFEMEYALRAAQAAARAEAGLLFVHAHPRGGGWQDLGDTDRVAEASIANLAREITGRPLVGMTLAGSDTSWSARIWDQGRGREVSFSEGESVRVVGDQFRVTFNDEKCPPPPFRKTQARTISAWGPRMQAIISRLRILVVGAGSVGSVVAERLARTGVQHLAVMDHETVEFVNLDRLLGAGERDAGLCRGKVDVSGRVLSQAATAKDPEIEAWDRSICEPEGLQRALDFDLVFSCVDRPWPRHVLNTIAYSDLIPVIDGGVQVKNLPDGSMRNAYWRSHTAMPWRPCLSCLGQYDVALVQVERDGSLELPGYMEMLPADSPLKANQNVALLSVASASAMLNQFVSLVVAPSGLADPGPLKHALATQSIERDPRTCVADCPFVGDTGVGDRRLDPTGPHLAAQTARAAQGSVSVGIRLLRSLDTLASATLGWLDRRFRNTDSA